MHNLLKKSITVIVLCLNTVVLISQVSTLSPYTRYGLGELNANSFGRSNGMGELFTTLRAPNQINIGNPASYSAQDTLSFIFDVGLNSRIVNYSTNEESESLNTSNIDHLAIGFPITRKLKVSTGIYPYSFIGYNVASNTSYDTSYSFLNKNKGEGGLNQLYLGAGYELMPGFSVGLNAFYIFGNIDYSNESSVYETNSANTYSFLYRRMDETKTRVDGIGLNFGMQYATDINDNQTLHIGATFKPSINLRSKYDKQLYKESTVYTNGAYTGQLNSDTIINIKGDDPIKTPWKLSLGLAYEFQDKLFLGIDYTFENWENFSYPTINSNLKNFQQVSIGAQYIPNPRAFNGYYNLIQYRLGGYYKQNYIYLNNTQITDFGLTAGLGFPMGGKTIINVSYKYGNRGTTDNNLILARYNQIEIGFSFYDFWFIKSKYD